LGTPVTYRISSTGISVVPTLIVSRPDDFNYQGGTHTYSVTSYRTISQTGYTTVNQPVPWTAEYSTDGGVTWTSSKPSWLTDFTESGDGSVSATSFNATVTAQTGKTHNQALQDATPLSNYDLSTKGGTTAMNTANCYIINAPGTYTFPLVYGNAIKNGATNTSSYISSASGTGVLTHFVNHLGNEITDPYIYNNTGCVPANACIAWQDAYNLVSNIALSADGHYVTFTVSASSIVQGNTLIVVRDASNIVLWSWHIWVTDYVPELPANNSDDAPLSDKNILSYNGNTYVLMPINLGWKDENLNNYYPSRSVKVKISQIGTNAVPVEFTIHQTAFPMSKKGYNTFYQWGRKDPTKTSYGNLYNQNLDFNCIKGPISLAEGIKNPNIFYMITSETDWCSSHYLNLWNANDVTMSNNVSTVVKTIYDPCPVGYEVAAPDCFSGFTVNGQDKNGTTNYKGQVNSASFNSPYLSGVEVTNNYGWFFYCNKMSGINSYDTSGGTIFFPNSGFKDRGNKNYSIDRAISWTATPYDSSNEACRFFASKVDVNPESHKSRAYGFPVRGMREQ
jgi:hypothetical protein